MTSKNTTNESVRSLEIKTSPEIQGTQEIQETPGTPGTQEIYNVSTCCSDDLMIDIFEHLKKIERTSTEVRKYWFNGEYDSNQTNYEWLSNNLKICVLASDKKVALVLHTFLRQIIDKHSNDWYLNSLYITCEANKKEFTMDEILDCLANSNDMYGQVFNPMQDGLYVKHSNRKSYKEYVANIDCWDLFRIGCGLGALYNENYWTVRNKR